MVWPLPVDEPRTDVRLPTYYRGHRFGTVPRSRVRISTSGGGDWWKFLRDGIVLQARDAPDTTGFMPNAFWEGDLVNEGMPLRCVLQINSIGYPDASPIQFTVTRQADPFGTTFWRGLVGSSFPISGQKFINLFVDQIGMTPPSFVIKDDVYEWSRPSERWPGVIITEPL